MYRPVVSTVLVLATLAGCTKDKEPAAQKATSQRERDSVLGQSKVPGATGVGKAMKVADSAAGRVQLQDSIAVSE